MSWIKIDWVTVYKDDDEAHDLWIKHTDVEPDRVLRFGNKDNFGKWVIQVHVVLAQKYIIILEN